MKIHLGFLFFLPHFVTSLVLAKVEPLSLPSIEVISDERLSLLSIPGSAHQLRPDELIEHQPLSFQDALKWRPGIHVVESEGFGFFPRIGLRGLSPQGSRRVLLLEDGVPTALSLYLDPSTDYSPAISRLESIEIIKGSSALRHGPHTYGGLINATSKSPPQIPGAKISWLEGSQQTRWFGAQAGATFENSGLLAQWNQFDGNGNRNSEPFQSGDGLLKFSLALGESHFVAVKMSYFQNLSQISPRGLTEAEYQADPLQNRARDDAFNLQRMAFDVQHEWELTPRSRLRTLFYTHSATTETWQQNIDLNTLDLLAGNIGRERQYQMLGLESRWLSNYNLAGQAHESELGVRLHQEGIDQSEYQGASAQSRVGDLDSQDRRLASAIATFYTHRWNLTERLSLIPALRFESFQTSRNLLWSSGAADGTLHEITEAITLPSAAISYRLLEELQLFAGWHGSFSPARIHDALTNTGQVSPLEPERGNTLEVGGRYLSSLLDWELSFFEINFENEIVAANEVSSPTAFAFVNGGQTLHQGLESQVRFHLLDPFFFDFQWTYLPTAELRGPLVQGNQSVAGNRLPYAPEHLVNAGVSFRIEDYFARIEYLHVGRQYTDLLNTEAGSANGRTGALPSYGVFNLNTRWQVFESLSVQASIKNLLDERYQASRTLGLFPGLRRHLFIGLEIAL